MALSPLEADFLISWRTYAPAFPLEFDNLSTCLPFRRAPYQYRSDFVHVQTKIAIEIQGGTWNRGKHGRGTGISIDAKKLAYAQLAGWLLFQIPSGEEREYLPIILEMIIERGGEPVPRSEPAKDWNEPISDEELAALNPF